MSKSKPPSPSGEAPASGLPAIRRALLGENIHEQRERFPNPHRRLLKTLQESRPVGPADCASLVRHVLRWEDENGGTNSNLRVPKEQAWPSRSMWERHGCQIESEDEATFLLTAQAWCPSWLPDADRIPPSAAAIAEEPRREFASVDGDPFLVARGDEYRQYLSVGQQASVRAALTAPEGATLAVNLPTGSGKSLCAQLPTALDDHDSGLTVVVVPTVALALDQEESMRSVVHHDTAYYGGNDSNEAIRNRIRKGAQRIVFTSPEGLIQGLAPAVFRAAQSDSLRHLVIDEAHIVDHWGNDFRSAFQELAGLRQGLLDECDKPFTTLLLSATFTEGTLETLETLFGQPGPFDQVSAARLRAEPSYWWSKVDSRAEKHTQVLDAVRHLPRPLILYTSIKEDVDKWSNQLHEVGYRRFRSLTGDTGSRQRQEILDEWREDALDIVVATSAFGLGIDKGDVRSVVHACLPENVNRFYQEVGRGGRDGNASVSLLVCYENEDDSEDDVHRAEGINRETILTVDTAFDRWTSMYKEREQIGGTLSDRYRLPVSASRDIDMQNEKNKAWNVRTLVLMHRAGLLRLEGEAPPQQHEEETDEEMQERLDEYYDHRVIELNMAAPRSKDEFEEAVLRRRMAMRRENEQGFEDMQTLLQGDRCVAKVLTSVYRVPRDGGAEAPVTNPVSPIPACGGCPACRASERAPYAFPRSNAAMPGWDRSEVHPSLKTLFKGGDLAVIFHESSDRDSRWERTARRIVRWCVARGIQRVVAPSDVINRWREAWRDRQLFVFLDDLTSEPIDPSAELDVPDLVFLPPDRPLPRQYLVPTVPRILFVPRQTPDPRRSSHLLWDTFRGTHFRFQAFRSEVHV